MALAARLIVSANGSRNASPRPGSAMSNRSNRSNVSNNPYKRPGSALSELSGRPNSADRERLHAWRGVVPGGGGGEDGGGKNPRDQNTREQSEFYGSKAQADLVGVEKGNLFDFDDEEMDKVEHLFNDIGKNNKDPGILTFSQMKMLFKTIYPGVPEVEIRTACDKVFSDLDCDNSGTLSWPELEDYLLAGGVTQDCRLIDEEMKPPEVLYDSPESWREWIWALVEQPASERYGSRTVRLGAIAVQIVLLFAIVLSLIAMVNASRPMYLDANGEVDSTMISMMENWCVSIFTIEFLLRMLACPLKEEEAERLRVPWQRWLWKQPWTYIDLSAIFPFYLEKGGALASGESSSLMILRMLRMLRLARAIRVMKLGRHSRFLQLMMLAFRQARHSILWMALMMLGAACIFGSIIFQAEQDEASFNFERQEWVRHENSIWPDAGSRIAYQSIPNSMWWAIVTLTTVGYGDQSPVTHLGKAIATVAMVSGILLVAYPTTVLTNVFEQASKNFEEAREQERHWKRAKMEQQQSGATAGTADKGGTDKGGAKGGSKGNLSPSEVRTSVAERKLERKASRTTSGDGDMREGAMQRKSSVTRASTLKHSSPPAPTEDEPPAPPLSSLTLSGALKQSAPVPPAQPDVKVSPPEKKAAKGPGRSPRKTPRAPDADAGEAMSVQSFSTDNSQRGGNQGSDAREKEKERDLVSQAIMGRVDALLQGLEKLQVSSHDTRTRVAKMRRDGDKALRSLGAELRAAASTLRNTQRKANPGPPARGRAMSLPVGGTRAMEWHGASSYRQQPLPQQALPQRQPMPLPPPPQMQPPAMQQMPPPPPQMQPPPKPAPPGRAASMPAGMGDAAAAAQQPRPPPPQHFVPYGMGGAAPPALPMAADGGGGGAIKAARQRSRSLGAAPASSLPPGIFGMPTDPAEPITPTIHDKGAPVRHVGTAS